ncbi:hypothetical protein [Desulfomarina profundi]|uniref:hypothetical protein n=1 Tax=Desulfomarina profundi TaxID=2772557 RepID=UPI001E5CC209|nr:hypothetical protein [Desulfomarina profundi]
MGIRLRQNNLQQADFQINQHGWTKWLSSRKQMGIRLRQNNLQQQDFQIKEGS